VEAFTRRLPHFYAVGWPLFVTWRLVGSLPVQRKVPSAITSGAAFVAMDRLVDCASVCPRFLQLPRIARVVTDAIRDPDRCPGQYQLHAFVVMPITFIC
jgi:hypothetical protein